MKVRFNCMIMKKQSYYAILMLLASTMLTACSSDDDELPAEFAGKWQLLYLEYGDGEIDTKVSATIVDFSAERKNYSIERGHLKKSIPDGNLVFNYVFMDNGQKLKLVFVSSEGIVFTTNPPTEVYQKIK